MFDLRGYELWICRSQMVSQEDYKFIVSFDVQDTAAREALLKSDHNQCAKTFLNLIGHVSKDQTLQYILVIIDDMLQVQTISLQINLWATAVP